MTQRLQRMMSLFAFSAACAATGCYTEPEEAELRIKLIDSETKAPLSGGLVSLEEGGIYVRNPDPSLASPAYVHGLQASSAGTMIFNLKTGAPKGIHSFVDGYYYGSRLVEVFDQDIGVTVNMKAFKDGETPPTISNAALSPDTVAPGAAFTLSADVTSPSASDPLSDEVIVIYPHAQESRALAPPSAGVQGQGYPDGTWSAALVAPSTAGSYEYYLTATSEHCVTSNVTILTLQVQ